MDHPAMLAGRTVGPYRIDALLGAGGMGEVYRAWDTRLRRAVALKFLAREFLSDAAAIDRFEREARAASALSHPNICTVYDVGEMDGRPFIAMEYLEGQDLRARLGGGPLPQRNAIEYAIQVAQGLAAAHQKGIVHRDLKPENLWVTPEGRIRILDFGLAKLSEPATLENARRTSPERAWPGDGNGGLHVAGTGAGQAVGLSDGYFFVRRNPVRNGGRQAVLFMGPRRSIPKSRF